MTDETGSMGMTVREAGRRGGEATKAKHGVEHFARIGAMARSKPRAFYQAIGRKGGRASAERRVDR